MLAPDGRTARPPSRAPTLVATNPTVAGKPSESTPYRRLDSAHVRFRRTIT